MIIGPFSCEQSLSFGSRLIPRTKIPIGIHNHQHPQHRRTLDHELEEGNFIPLTSEIMECHHSDARQDAFDGTRLLPELDIEPASGFSSILGMDVQSLEIGKASEDDEQHLGITADSKSHIHVQGLDRCDRGTWIRPCPSLDDGSADLKLILSQLEVSKQEQRGGMGNLDPVLQALRFISPQEQPLEARGVDDGEAVQLAAVDLQAAQAVADEAETKWKKEAFKAEDFQHGAPGQDELDVPGIDVDAAEAELAEAGERGAAREAGRRGEPQEAEVEPRQRPHAEKRGGEVLVDLQRRAVDEEELLDALDSEELEPPRDAGAVSVHVAAGEVGAAERAAVRGEDDGDGGSGGVGVGALDAARDVVRGRREEVGVVEDERSGEPDGAPAVGQRGGARGVLDGEARDDVAEERVGEAAEAVGATAVGGVGEGAEAAADRDRRGWKGAVDGGERAADERVEMRVPGTIGGTRDARRGRR